MKIALLITAFCCCCGIVAAQQNACFTDVNGITTYISSLPYKRIIIVELPEQRDTVLVQRLVRFQQRYGDSIQVVGLVKLDSVHRASVYARLYAPLSRAGVIVSAGLTGQAHTPKEQVLQNIARQHRTLAVGNKYFISRNGTLYGSPDRKTGTDDSSALSQALTYIPGEMPVNRLVFTGINKTTVAAGSYPDKKLLIQLLPARVDTAVLQSLLRFQQRYENKIQVVAFVKTDSLAALSDSLLRLYAPLMEAGVIVSSGVTGGVSSLKEEVIQWIAGINAAGAAEGGYAGSKFFISGKGRMYARLSAGTSLDNIAATNLAVIQVPGE